MFRSPRVVLSRVFLRVSLACCWLCSSLFTGSRVPSLAVSLLHGQFGSCFIQLTIHQPTIHPLGLKASGVHDHCKKRRSEHRISNLLNTLNVKDLQNVSMCILPSSTHCTSSHGLPNMLTQRFAKHSVSNGLSSIPAQPRHSDLEHSRARGRPHTLEFLLYSTHPSELISLSSSRDFKHQCQRLDQNHRSQF